MESPPQAAKTHLTVSLWKSPIDVPGSVPRQICVHILLSRSGFQPSLASFLPAPPFGLLPLLVMSAQTNDPPPMKHLIHVEYCLESHFFPTRQLSTSQTQLRGHLFGEGGGSQELCSDDCPPGVMVSSIWLPLHPPLLGTAVGWHGVSTRTISVGFTTRSLIKLFITCIHVRGCDCKPWGCKRHR